MRCPEPPSLHRPASPLPACLRRTRLLSNTSPKAHLRASRRAQRSLGSAALASPGFEATRLRTAHRLWKRCSGCRRNRRKSASRATTALRDNHWGVSRHALRGGTRPGLARRERPAQSHPRLPSRRSRRSHAIAWRDRHAPGWRPADAPRQVRPAHCEHAHLNASSVAAASTLDECSSRRFCFARGADVGATTSGGERWPARADAETQPPGRWLLAMGSFDRLESRDFRHA